MNANLDDLIQAAKTLNTKELALLAMQISNILIQRTMAQMEEEI